MKLLPEHAGQTPDPPRLVHIHQPATRRQRVFKTDRLLCLSGSTPLDRMSDLDHPENGLTTLGKRLVKLLWALHDVDYVTVSYHEITVHIGAVFTWTSGLDQMVRSALCEVFNADLVFRRSRPTPPKRPLPPTADDPAG